MNSDFFFGMFVGGILILIPSGIELACANRKLSLLYSEIRALHEELERAEPFRRLWEGIY